MTHPTICIIAIASIFLTPKEGLITIMRIYTSDQGSSDKTFHNHVYLLSGSTDQGLGELIAKYICSVVYSAIVYCREDSDIHTEQNKDMIRKANIMIFIPSEKMLIDPPADIKEEVTFANKEGICVLTLKKDDSIAVDKLHKHFSLIHLIDLRHNLSALPRLLKKFTADRRHVAFVRSEGVDDKGYFALFVRLLYGIDGKLDRDTPLMFFMNDQEDATGYASGWRQNMGSVAHHYWLGSSGVVFFLLEPEVWGNSSKFFLQLLDTADDTYCDERSFPQFIEFERSKEDLFARYMEEHTDLGRMYLELIPLSRKMPEKAYEVFKTAEQTLNRYYPGIYTGTRSQQAALSLFCHLAYVCILLKKEEEAITNITKALDLYSSLELNEDIAPSVTILYLINGILQAINTGRYSYIKALRIRAIDHIREASAHAFGTYLWLLCFSDILSTASASPSDEDFRELTKKYAETVDSIKTAYPDLYVYFSVTGLFALGRYLMTDDNIIRCKELYDQFSVWLQEIKSLKAVHPEMFDFCTDMINNLTRMIDAV